MVGIVAMLGTMTAIGQACGETDIQTGAEATGN